MLEKKRALRETARSPAHSKPKQQVRVYENVMRHHQELMLQAAVKAKRAFEVSLSDSPDEVRAGHIKEDHTLDDEQQDELQEAVQEAKVMMHRASRIRARRKSLPEPVTSPAWQPDLGSFEFVRCSSDPLPETSELETFEQTDVGHLRADSLPLECRDTCAGPNPANPPRRRRRNSISGNARNCVKFGSLEIYEFPRDWEQASARPASGIDLHTLAWKAALSHSSVLQRWSCTWDGSKARYAPEDNNHKV